MFQQFKDSNVIVSDIIITIQIKSKEGERIPLVKPVSAQGNVEVWLGDLMKMSQKSLHAVIREAYMLIGQEGFSLLEFINIYAAQVCTYVLKYFKR